MPDCVSLEAGELRIALAAATKGTERRSTLPILSNVLIASDGKILSVTGTDTEVQISATTGADGTLRAVTVNGEHLAGLIAASPPDETATITRDGDSLKLNVGALYARLDTLPAEDFPTLAARRGKSWDMGAAAFLRLMTRPAHAVSTEESRYYLNGIFLHLNSTDARKPTLAACATDGHRLFLTMLGEDDAVIVPPGLGGMIVPRGSCGAIAAMLEREVTGASVRITAGENSLSVAGNGWRLDTKLIDGKFPDYARVIPTEEGAILHVRAPALLAKHIATVAVVAEGKSRPVLIGGEGRTASLRSTGQGLAEALIRLPDGVAEWAKEGQHPAFGAQARYLRDICAALPNGFQMHVKDGASAVLVRDGSATSIAALMPMRV